MKSLTYTIKSLLYSMIFLTSATGCQDDIHFSDPANGIGEPVTVTLQLSLPEMTPQSRADISDEVANEVTDIWVGIFDASGKLTGHKYQSVNHNDTHVTHTVSVDTKTGPSHIVAVANTANNYGVMLTDGNADSRAQTTILDLLEQEGLNWDIFLSIANLLPQPGSIETPNGHIPMCGIYSDDSDPKNHPTDSWESLYNKTFDIPANGQLSGHIHLRRLISQVKVQLQVTGNIVDIEPYSWKVINVPRASWLLERNGDKTNATDAVTGDDNWLDDSPVYGPEYFPFIDKVKFDDKGNYVQDDSNNKAFVFDFWQTENKHTIGCYSYEDRESAARNNDVTYIEFKCRITYRTIPENSSNDQYLDGGTVSRTADATYIIPLGGIDDDSDFNHRRNSRYIYNVTISDVTQILVEAHTNEEKRPGVEGIVTDLTNPMVSLDAHYSVMNVKFTRKELRGTGGKFPFLLRVRDKDDHIIEIDQNNYTGIDELYVNWIEVMHTDDQSEYAVYKPASTFSETTKYIYQLTDFANNNTIWKTDDESEEQWFTVFFNEYVYETGSTTYNWKDYVNKGNREVWFLANQSKSNDGNSIHLKAKYSASQQSIQTYYSNNAEKAIGVEHLNETLGARLRFTTNISTVDSNGKINLVRYIVANNSNWNQYVQRTTPLKIPRITNQKGIAEQAVYVPSPALLLPPYEDNDYDPDGDNDNYYVEVINACMNRNRDLNGNGEIEKSELRWYVPTARQYQRIILGRMSLTSPIMQDFENITLELPTSNVNTRYHIAASDNTKIWAEEGLSKSNFDDGKGQFNSWRYGAWQVRCIRNLGGDADYKDESDLLIPYAYTHDKANRIIKLDNYETKSKRNNMIVGNMPPHHIYDQSYNRLYKAFQYAETSTILEGQYSPTGSNYETRWTNILNTLNPCASLNTNGESGWRVPNQKELTILFYLDVIREKSEVYYLSATHEYFNKIDGTGFSGDRSYRRYLGTIEKPDGTNSDATAVNFDLGNKTFKTRCVRDFEQP